MRRPPSERFERSPWGRALLSAFVVLAIGLAVATHLPSSPVQEAIEDPADHVARLLGMEQSWAVFAPNPRSISLNVEARVTFADGSTTTWTVPTGPQIVTNLRFYRWRKWMERLRTDRREYMWRPTAEWIAAIHSDGPSPVTRVELVRYFRETVLASEPAPWQRFTYFTLDVAEP